MEPELKIGDEVTRKPIIGKVVEVSLGTGFVKVEYEGHPRRHYWEVVEHLDSTYVEGSWFQVGDRVVCVVNDDGPGTVVEVWGSASFIYEVELDKDQSIVSYDTLFDEGLLKGYQDD